MTKLKKSFIALGTFLVIIVAFVAITFLIRPAWGLIGVNIPYSEGDRTVKIVKLTEKGLIWKTWEAEGVITQGDFAVTYIWGFSVDNKDTKKMQLVSDLRRAFESGQTIKVHYEQRAGSVPWRSETNYWVKDIRFPVQK